MIHDDTLSAARAVDQMLDEADENLLALISLFRLNILSMIGRDAIVGFITSAVDKAECVTYFSRRSRREIDPARPEVSLRVNDSAALSKYPELLASYAGDIKRNTSDLNVVSGFKGAVIFEEVCKCISKELNEVISKRWDEKGRAEAMKIAKDPEKVRLILSSMFAVRVSQEPVPNSDRMCILSFIL